MKNWLILLIINVICFPLCNLDAQVQKNNANIIKELNSYKSGNSRVIIHQDTLISSILKNDDTTDINSDSYSTIKGFKIQIFSGNNQRTSKEEAYDKLNLVKEKFPNLDAVVTFSAPFWRLRAGNFKLKNDAFLMLDKIKNQFPDFGREMYIVEDDIKDVDN